MTTLLNDGLEYRFEHGDTLLIAGLRRQQPFTNIHQNIPQQWQAFTQHILASGVLHSYTLHADPSTTPVTYGIICGSTDTSMEYMCGIEVASLERISADIGRVIITPQNYVVFSYQGPITGIGAAWQAILHTHLPSVALISAQRPAFERYDHRYNSSTNTGLVEIWLPIIKN